MYLLRQQFSDTVQIAKFEDSREPTAVYSVKGSRCNCPSYKACKHINIVKDWKKMGSPIGAIFDDIKFVGTLNV